MKVIIFSLLVFVCQQVTRSLNEKNDYFLRCDNINDPEFFLVGSMQAGMPENYSLPDAYLNAFNLADNVILEIKEGLNELKRLKFNYEEKDSQKEGQYLDKYLSPERKVLYQYFSKVRKTSWFVILL